MYIALYAGIRENAENCVWVTTITPTSFPSYYREPSISGSPNVANRTRPGLHLQQDHELS